MDLWVFLRSSPHVNTSVSVISIGTFTVDEEGRATVIFELDEPIGKFAGAGVTIEPPGGSPAPTGDLAIGGEI